MHLSEGPHLVLVSEIHLCHILLWFCARSRSPLLFSALDSFHHFSRASERSHVGHPTIDRFISLRVSRRHGGKITNCIALNTEKILDMKFSV